MSAILFFLLFIGITTIAFALYLTGVIDMPILIIAIVINGIFLSPLLIMFIDNNDATSPIISSDVLFIDEQEINNSFDKQNRIYENISSGPLLSDDYLSETNIDDLLST